MTAGKVTMNQDERQRRVEDQLVVVSQRLDRGDHKFDEMRDEVTKLKAEMQVNTEVTMEIRDIVTSFRTLSRFAKWVGGMAITATAVYHAWSNFWAIK